MYPLGFLNNDHGNGHINEGKNMPKDIFANPSYAKLREATASAPSASDAQARVISKF